MYKRSQVTIFVILGLIILVLVSLLLYSKNLGIKENVLDNSSISSPPTLIIPAQNPLSSVSSLNTYKSQNIPFNENGIKQYLTTCLDNQMRSTIRYMALQGGMFVPRSDSVVTSYGAIASYPSDVNPSTIRPEVETQISKAAQSVLEQCLDLQNSGNSPALDVTPGRLSVKITANNIQLTLEKPAVLSTAYSDVTIKDLSLAIPSNYDKVLGVEEKIIRQNALDTEWLDLSYLNSLTLPVSILPYSGDAVVYSIEDSSQTPQTRYLFAIRSDSNSAPKLDFIPDVRLKEGTTWTYNLMATDRDGDAVYYYCNSNGCNVDAQTGELTYVAPSAGTYTLTVGARDSSGKSSTKEVTVYVET
jgi:hypothetical protein